MGRLHSPEYKSIFRAGEFDHPDITGNSSIPARSVESSIPGFLRECACYRNTGGDAAHFLVQSSQSRTVVRGVRTCQLRTGIPGIGGTGSCAISVTWQTVTRSERTALVREKCLGDGGPGLVRKAAVVTEDRLGGRRQHVLRHSVSISEGLCAQYSDTKRSLKDSVMNGPNDCSIRKTIKSLNHRKYGEGRRRPCDKHDNKSDKKDQKQNEKNAPKK